MVRSLLYLVVSLLGNSCVWCVCLFVYWLVCLLVGLLVCWLVGVFVSWLVGLFVGRSCACLACWFVGEFASLLVGLVVGVFVCSFVRSFVLSRLFVWFDGLLV